jgi:Ala-tRNA(Pro) deacylase
MRIADFLAEHHADYEALPHPPAFTAQRRAKTLHVPGSLVAKAVLLHAPAGYLIAILPAPHDVDTDALAEPLGGLVRLASEAEIADVFPDCEWGVVPPFGSLYRVKTILEASLAPETFLVLEMHTHYQAIRMRCRDFEQLERPRRLSFGRLRK